VIRVGVNGAGKAGSARALALIMRGAAREIVLDDRPRARQGGCNRSSLRYSAAPLVDIRDDDYGDLAGAALVMVTAAR
jgi:malate/lactate dehydrogenase